MKQKIKFSIILGAIAGLFWTIADILLVGFIPQREKFSSFVELLPKTINSDFAILMLEGGVERLMYGVYFATFSVFLYLLSVYGIYQLSPKKIISKFAVLFLFIGYATSPVGHTGFAYLGLLSKSLQTTTPEIIQTQTALFEQFQHLLDIHWIVSVSFSALGWLLLLIQTLKNQFITKWLAIFNPILTAPLIGFTASLFPTTLVAVWFGCASLNISQFLFFLCLLLFYSKSHKSCLS